MRQCTSAVVVEAARTRTTSHAPRGGTAVTGPRCHEASASPNFVWDSPTSRLCTTPAEHVRHPGDCATVCVCVVTCGVQCRFYKHTHTHAHTRAEIHAYFSCVVLPGRGVLRASRRRHPPSATPLLHLPPRPCRFSSIRDSGQRPSSWAPPRHPSDAGSPLSRVCASTAHEYGGGEGPSSSG